MMFSLFLLVAVLTAHPSLGALIPDTNVDSRSTIAFRSVNKNSANVNTNKMADKARTDDATPAPPKNATFLTECNLPATAFMQDLCWLDETTVLVLDINYGGRIIKYDIDLKLRLCKWSTLYRGVPGQSLSCASNEEIYVSDGHNNVVRIYKGRNITEWQPNDVDSYTGISVNDNRIALGFLRKPVNMYNRQRDFLYNISSDADNYNMAHHLSLSPSSSHLVACVPYDDYIFIHDLFDNTTIRVESPGPYSSSFDTSGQYVLVCEWRKERISVYGVGGVFIHVLQLGPGGSSLTIVDNIATIKREGKSSLLAVQMQVKGINNINIYSLST